MEDSFHLEHIKEELYKTQSSDVNGEKKEKINAKKTSRRWSLQKKRLSRKIMKTGMNL